MAKHTSHSSHGSGDNAEIGDLLQTSLTKGLEQMEHHSAQDGENDTAKLFGLFEMDSGVVAAANTAYTTFIGLGTTWLTPKTYRYAYNAAKHIQVSGHALSHTALNRTAAGASLAANLGLIFANDIAAYSNEMKRHHEQKADISRRLAPVLNDIKGSHSMGAFMSVTAEQNSVLYAHRRRMTRTHSTKTNNIVMAALGANIPNLMLQGVPLRGLISGTARSDIIIGQAGNAAKVKELEAEFRDDRRHAKKTDEQINELVENQLTQDKLSNGSYLAQMIGSGTFKTISNTLVKSSERKLKKSMQPYSALDMILALEDQMQNNPGRQDSFQLPQNGRELPLKQYVAEIFKHHQKELADFNPKQTEIRKALHNDLDQIAGMIAERMQSGDLSPNLLIHLVGEGRIVRKQGRGLVSPEEAQTQIEHFAGKSRSFDSGDTKEFFKERNFTLDHVKEGLHHLKGDEKLDFAATLPDDVLMHAGMTAEELKTVQQHRVHEGYDTMLTHAIAALAAKSDEALQKDGLGKTQIQQLREASQTIAQGGAEALKQLKSGPTNAEGVEHLLMDAVVPHVAGNKEYLGKLLADGRTAAEKASAEAGAIADHAANDEDGAAPGQHANRFTAKARREHEDKGFADREDTREEAFQQRH